MNYDNSASGHPPGRGGTGSSLGRLEAKGRDGPVEEQMPSDLSPVVPSRIAR